MKKIFKTLNITVNDTLDWSMQSEVNKIWACLKVPLAKAKIFFLIKMFYKREKMIKIKIDFLKINRNFKFKLSYLPGKF